MAVFLVGWIASVARVAGAVVSSETFGAEPTIALFFVAGMPLLLGDALKQYGRRFRGRPDRVPRH